MVIIHHNKGGATQLLSQLVNQNCHHLKWLNPGLMVFEQSQCILPDDAFTTFRQVLHPAQCFDEDRAGTTQKVTQSLTEILTASWFSHNQQEPR